MYFAESRRRYNVFTSSDGQGRGARGLRAGRAGCLSRGARCGVALLFDDLDSKFEESCVYFPESALHFGETCRSEFRVGLRIAYSIGEALGLTVTPDFVRFVAGSLVGCF